MPGELSPDRNFYWDGQGWISATSPDGAWRWDGGAWRPAASATRRRQPWFASAVALMVTVSVVLGVIGIYFAGKAFINASPRFLPGGLGSVCNSPLSQPGAALRSGDSVCGGTLGVEDMLADCTLSDAAPSGITVWEQTYQGNSWGDWTKTTVSATSQGCNLSAPSNVFLNFETSARQPAQTVVVADFVWEASENNVGIRLACTAEASCVDLSMFSEGLYTVFEGRPNDGWDTLSKGVSFAGTFRQRAANRMILRLRGRHVSGFMNGADVVEVDTHRAQSSGFISFYLDNRDAGVDETVWLQRLYIFESR